MPANSTPQDYERAYIVLCLICGWYYGGAASCPYGCEDQPDV